MASACERAFNTPELLEAILLQLQPRRYILSAQRVSTNFHRAIIRCPHLQQALFLRAEPSDAVDDPKAWTVNPILRHFFLPWFLTGVHDWSMTYDTIRMLDCASNSKNAFLQAEASWRKMLVIQPPQKQLVVRQCAYSSGGDFVTEATVSFDDSGPGGVTMGAVYDLTESFLRQNGGYRFGLSFKDSSDKPRLTLYLEESIGCCDSDSEGEEVEDFLISKGARSEWNTGRLECKQVPGPQWLEEDWIPDLPPENGGVTAKEWKKWKTERQSRSSVDTLADSDTIEIIRRPSPQLDDT